MPMPVEVNVLPLLKAMHEEVGGEGRVFHDLGDEREFARIIRADLLVAGVSRRALHECSDDPPREWMTMHDCRTTGITWMAVRGDDPLVVMARAGHHDLKMTQAYVNLGAVLRRGHGYGEVFPVLPECLVSVRSAAE